MVFSDFVVGVAFVVSNGFDDVVFCLIIIFESGFNGFDSGFYSGL